MKYELGDKFHIEGQIGKVAYINAGMAWLVPIEGNTHVAFIKLNQKGYSEKGHKAYPVNETECGAV